MRNNADLNTVEGKVLEAKRTALIKAHVYLINYSLKHAYSFHRWKMWLM
jgi:hypothetical protein